jgi:hypothetical protein
MSMCTCSMFVMFSVHVATLRGADPPSKEPYSLCKKIM